MKTKQKETWPLQMGKSSAVCCLPVSNFQYVKAELPCGISWERFERKRAVSRQLLSSMPGQMEYIFHEPPHKTAFVQSYWGKKEIRQVIPFAQSAIGLFQERKKKSFTHFQRQHGLWKTLASVIFLFCPKNNFCHHFLHLTSEMISHLSEPILYLLDGLHCKMLIKMKFQLCGAGRCLTLQDLLLDHATLWDLCQWGPVHPQNGGQVFAVSPYWYSQIQHGTSPIRMNGKYSWIW